MSRFSKSREGCPRETSYGQACPYDPQTGLCSAVMSIDAPCPFFQNADPDCCHGEDTLTPTATPTAAAAAPFVASLRQTLIRRLTRHAATVAAAEVKRQTPGTAAHLNMRLKEIEDRRQQQIATANDLKIERQHWAQCLMAEGRPVTWETRQELAAFLPDHDLRWPTGCPILTLGAN